MTKQRSTEKQNKSPQSSRILSDYYATLKSTDVLNLDHNEVDYSFVIVFK